MGGPLDDGAVAATTAVEGDEPRRANYRKLFERMKLAKAKATGAPMSEAAPAPGRRDDDGDGSDDEDVQFRCVASRHAPRSGDEERARALAREIAREEREREREGGSHLIGGRSHDESSIEARALATTLRVSAGLGGRDRRSRASDKDIGDGDEMDDSLKVGGRARDLALDISGMDLRDGPRARRPFESGDDVFAASLRLSARGGRGEGSDLKVGHRGGGKSCASGYMLTGNRNPEEQAAFDAALRISAMAPRTRGRAIIAGPESGRDVDLSRLLREEDMRLLREDGETDRRASPVPGDVELSVGSLWSDYRRGTRHDSSSSSSGESDSDAGGDFDVGSIAQLYHARGSKTAARQEPEAVDDGGAINIEQLYCGAKKAREIRTQRVAAYQRLAREGSRADQVLADYCASLSARDAKTEPRWQGVTFPEGLRLKSLGGEEYAVAHKYPVTYGTLSKKVAGSLPRCSELLSEGYMDAIHKLFAKALAQAGAGTAFGPLHAYLAASLRVTTPLFVVCDKSPYKWDHGTIPLGLASFYRLATAPARDAETTRLIRIYTTGIRAQERVAGEQQFTERYQFLVCFGALPEYVVQYLRPASHTELRAAAVTVHI